MIGKHVPDATLEKLCERRLNRQQVLKVSWHLVHCVRCQSRLGQLSDDTLDLVLRLFGPKPDTAPEVANDHVDSKPYESAMRQVRQRISTDVGRSPASLDEVMASLLARPEAAAQVRIRTERELQTPALAHRLLDHASVNGSDQHLAAGATRLALEVLEQLEDDQAPETVRSDLRSRALALLGNSARVSHDYAKAQRHLDEAHRLVERGTGDPEIEAQILHLRSSLHRDRRQLDDAIKAVDRAILLYRQAGDQHMVGCCLLTKATSVYYRNSPSESCLVLEEAVSLLDARRDPRLLAGSLLNLASYLGEGGAHDKALATAEQARAAFQAIGSHWRDFTKVDWVQGQIALAAGDLERAESILTQVRDQFLQHDEGYDACLVSLDLSEVFLRQARPADARSLAEQVLPIVEAHDIPADAIAAMVAWTRAAELEKLTSAVLHDVRNLLTRHRNAVRYYASQAH